MAKSMPKGDAGMADLLSQVLRDFLSVATAPPPKAKKLKKAMPAAPEMDDEDDEDEDDEPAGLMPPMPMKGRRVTISILMPTKGMMKKRGAK